MNTRCKPGPVVVLHFFDHELKTLPIDGAMPDASSSQDASEVKETPSSSGLAGPKAWLLKTKPTLRPQNTLERPSIATQEAMDGRYL
ncbi:hypothetical protein HPB51_003586 [Rhipicephalus microplus]|uniref:Uncharacterized protein n=1 Tax=Rhipicephalus microplus TaxID=6941 RepID=A0A9J6D3W2_RHIMP|nr:hypothetical protein HPB51_003586 [Rhipicephalus microplus]